MTTKQLQVKEVAARAERAGLELKSFLDPDRGVVWTVREPDGEWPDGREVYRSFWLENCNYFIMGWAGKLFQQARVG